MDRAKGLRFRWAPNLIITYKLEKSLSQTAKGRPALRRREKQRAKPEIHRKGGLVSEFYKNAKKMVSKSSKHGKTHKQFKCFFFSDRYNLFKDTFH